MPMSNALLWRGLRTIRDKIQKYLTHYNTFRFIDDLLKYVTAYNNTVHTSKGMAPARVGVKDVLQIFLWARLAQKGIRTAKRKFIVGQNVRISKQKSKFDISSTQNFPWQYSRLLKLLVESLGLCTSSKILTKHLLTDSSIRRS
jgi:hypothetical protein